MPISSASHDSRLVQHASSSHTTRSLLIELHKMKNYARWSMTSATVRNDVTYLSKLDGHKSCNEIHTTINDCHIHRHLQLKTLHQQLNLFKFKTQQVAAQCGLKHEVLIQNHNSITSNLHMISDVIALLWDFDSEWPLYKFLLVCYML